MRLNVCSSSWLNHPFVRSACHVSLCNFATLASNLQAKSLLYKQLDRSTPCYFHATLVIEQNKHMKARRYCHWTLCGLPRRKGLSDMACCVITRFRMSPQQGQYLFKFLHHFYGRTVLRGM